MFLLTACVSLFCMLARLTSFFETLMQRYLPDAFIFAVLLSFFVYIVGLALTPHDALEMITFWGSGLDNLFKFAMEMVLVLVTGFTLAKTKFVSIVLDKLALLAKSPGYAIILATLVSAGACFINWGFGLVVAGLFSVELAKRVEKVNFGLLVAASYSGFLIWHGGLSGSIPLKLTSPSDEIGVILGSKGIPLAETIFSSFNILLVGLHLLVLVLLNYFLNKNSTNNEELDIHLEEQKFYQEEARTPAQRLENSRWLTIILSAMGFVYIGATFAQNQSLNLNLIILLFFFLGLFLHQSPKAYLFHFSNSVKDSSGIILQFPLYAGIMSMMKMSGLGAMVSEFFISISTKETFLLYTYWSAGLVNFFVPSGGGQWAVQAPFILPAAKELGVDLAKASMAIAWGDAWTNMVQPFWALPLLSVAKLPLKALMSYSVIIFIVIGVVSSGYFLVLS